MAGAGEAGGVDAAIVDSALRVAQILTHGQPVVEGMLELVAGRALARYVFVEVWFADEKVLRDASGRRIGDCAPPWEKPRHGAAVVFLQVAQQGQ
ncbi:hypothetical protein WJ971_17810 [Achromobacter xylosoxidans]